MPHETRVQSPLKAKSSLIFHVDLKRPKPGSAIIKSVRICIITESYPPHVNGVSNTARRAAHHARNAGHDVLVIAPSPQPAWIGRYTRIEGIDVYQVPALAVPGYSSFTASTVTYLSLRPIISRFNPDVIHAASPLWLGHAGTSAAKSLGIPIVAAYQTDIPAYVGRYGVDALRTLALAQLRRIHSRAHTNLVPSSVSAQQLSELGVGRLRMWGRGVDHANFSPARRAEGRAWWNRHGVGLGGRRIVGFVGRLAPEKQVEDLSVLLGGRHGLPAVDADVAVIGDGPARASVAAALPGAHMMGLQQAPTVGAAIAGLDVLVHTGPHETYCQVVQEGQSAGVPVVSVAAGGPLDLIEDGITGLLYEPGNLQQLQHHVEELLARPEWAAKIAEAGAEAVADRTWDAINDQLLGHWSTAASTGKRLKSWTV